MLPLPKGNPACLVILGLGFSFKHLLRFLFGEPSFISLDSLESADFFGHKQFLGYFKIVGASTEKPKNSPLGADNARLQKHISWALCVRACTSVFLGVLTGAWLLNSGVGKLVPMPCLAVYWVAVTGGLVILLCFYFCLSVCFEGSAVF